MGAFEELIFDPPSALVVTWDRPPLVLTGSDAGFAGQNMITRLVTTASGGTLTLNPDGLGATGSFAGNASPSTIKAALDAHASIAPGDTIVTGGPLGSASTPVFIEWTGQFAQRLFQVVASGTGTTGLATSREQLAIPASPLILEEFNLTPPGERAEWISGADSEHAILARDVRYDLREIPMRIRVAPQATMDDALDAIGRLREKFRVASTLTDGVPMLWTPSGSMRTAIIDVLLGRFEEGVGPGDGKSNEGYWWLQKTPTPAVKLTCKPAMTAATETFTTAASSSLPLITHSIQGVGGDLPALGRLIITDNATQARRHVEWGVEGPEQDHSLALLLDSDSLVLTGTSGTTGTLSGAYDPNATGANVVAAAIGDVPVVIAKTGNLSHVGTYHVRARLQAIVPTGLGVPDQRCYAALTWQVKGGEFTTNAWEPLPQNWTFRDIDLGIVTIPEAAIGSQQWSAYVSGWCPGGDFSPETMYLDYLLLIPVDAGYGKARGTYATDPGPLLGRDNFSGMGGFLNARVAPLGGTWATSGVATDFAANSSSMPGGGPSVTRSTVSEGVSRRFAALGSTNYTDTTVQVTVAGSFGVGPCYGVIARYIDANNYIAFEQYDGMRRLYQVVGGSAGVFYEEPSWLADNSRVTLRLTVLATGRIIAELVGVKTLEAFSAHAATGGALDDGKPGISDMNTSATAFARYYTSFYAFTPPAENLAIHSGRALQVRHDDTLRQDSTGAFYGRPGSYVGSRFTVPVGDSRAAVKTRRYDVETSLDDGITDSTTVQVGYRERWLIAPTS